MSRSARANFYTPIMDVFHPNEPICQILPTTTTPRKDAFNQLRPAPFTCEDYHLSQTDIQLDGGATKIHIKQTEASFVPLPEPVKPKRKRKIRYGSGGPPVWEFVDEKWRREQDQLQIMYKKQFKTRVKMLRKTEKLARATTHNNLLKMVGPEWFQELSPKQMRTADNLKSCILKDLQDGTIINTQENIASLGLVLRPNHRHIKIALRECCQNPVEFLLVLYQLINPQRSEYSINDRLLLSSVVHLSMQSVLKELHIRIPSPPRPTKTNKKTIKPKKKLHYESPYLVPYTFERDPPRFTGVYYDKHLQRPESPYFAYLEEFKRMLNDAANTLPDPEEASNDEILEELLYAQELYENLVTYRPVRVLLKPSIYIPCVNIRNPPPPADQVQVLETIKEDKEEEAVQVNGDEQIAEEETEEAEEEEEQAKDDKPCEAVRTEAPEPYCLKIEAPQQIAESKEVVPVQESTTTTSSDESQIDSVHESCGCKSLNKQFIKAPLCPCDRCEEDRRHKVKQTSNMELRLLENVLDYKKPPDEEVHEMVMCDCLERYKKRISDYEWYQKRQRAVKNLKEQDNQYVIGGVTDTRHGPIFILECVRPKINCACVYKAHRDEEERVRIANAPKIPGGRVKYVISGIKATPNGNVFILSSAIPIDDCKCMKVYEKFETKHHTCNELYQAYLNKMKNTFNKYMQDLLPSPEEKRSTLDSIRKESYRKSIEGASSDEEDVEQVDESTAFPDTDKSQEVQTKSSSSSSSSGSDEMYQQLSRPCCMASPRPCCGAPPERKKPCGGCGSRKARLEKIPEKPSQESARSLDWIQKSANKGICKKPKKKPCKNCKLPKPVAPPPCTCAIPIEIPCFECTCAPPEPSVQEEEVEEEERTRELKRFFIFDRISCSKRWQLGVVEKALASMAEDGYPLAKLPDCHKLPHFKLWMEMRCRKFWTMQQKADTVLTSKIMWRHTNICKRNVAVTFPAISKDNAKLLTWANADKCRQLANDAKSIYYRQLRQAYVDFGREFFPTTFSYEFPFKTFRDCYFAYTPSKEEDVLAQDVWAPYEHK